MNWVIRLVAVLGVVGSLHASQTQPTELLYHCTVDDRINIMTQRLSDEHIDAVRDLIRDFHGRTSPELKSKYLELIPMSIRTIEDAPYEREVLDVVRFIQVSHDLLKAEKGWDVEPGFFLTLMIDFFYAKGFATYQINDMTDALSLAFERGLTGPLTEMYLERYLEFSDPLSAAERLGSLALTNFPNIDIESFESDRLPFEWAWIDENTTQEFVKAVETTQNAITAFDEMTLDWADIKIIMLYFLTYPTRDLGASLPILRDFLHALYNLSALVTPHYEQDLMNQWLAPILFESDQWRYITEEILQSYGTEELDYIELSHMLNVCVEMTAEELSRHFDGLRSNVLILPLNPTINLEYLQTYIQTLYSKLLDIN